MASLESLQDQVSKLEALFSGESAKTESLEKEVKALQEELAALKAGRSKESQQEKKGDTNGAESPKVAKKTASPTPTKKEEVSEDSESSDSESSDSSSSSGEEVKTASSTSPKTTAKSVSVKDSPIVVREKEGYLHKKGTVRHNWLKRYFKIDTKNHYLMYYSQKGDKEPKGIIPLVNATTYAHVEKKGAVKPLFFNIRTETRDFLMKAETAEEKADWVKAIKAQCVQGEMPEDAKKILQKKASSFIGETAADRKKQELAGASSPKKEDKKEEAKSPKKDEKKEESKSPKKDEKKKDEKKKEDPKKDEKKDDKKEKEEKKDEKKEKDEKKDDKKDKDEKDDKEDKKEKE